MFKIFDEGAQIEHITGFCLRKTFYNVNKMGKVKTVLNLVFKYKLK